jgi:hypothetical protein
MGTETTHSGRHRPPVTTSHSASMDSGEHRHRTHKTRKKQR